MFKQLLLNYIGMTEDQIIQESSEIVLNTKEAEVFNKCNDFIDEYKNQAGNLQCVQQIVDRLADCGFIAIDSDNKVDMANAENMCPFIDSLESGEHVEVLILQVFNIGGLNLLEIVADEGNVSGFQSPEITIANSTKKQVIRLHSGSRISCLVELFCLCR